MNQTTIGKESSIDTIDKTTLENLLQPLGLKVVQGGKFKFLTIDGDIWTIEYSNNEIIKMNTAALVSPTLAKFIGLDCLWEAICKSNYFISNWCDINKKLVFIMNPYVNCKSLEEALVKRDLMD